MHRFMLTALAFAALGAAIPASAVTAGKVLFAQPGTEIVNEKGERRGAKRGDSIEAGERLITQAGGISQVLLPDGSLVGVRPSSEIKLDAPPSSEKSAPSLSLVGGALRVIGSDLMDAQKPSVLTLKSGVATLKLAGADLETAVVRSGDASRPVGAAADAGTYTRLLVGTGSIATAGVADAALTQRQVAFVGTQPTAPVVISSVSLDVFNAPLPTSLRTGVAPSGAIATTSTTTTTTGTRLLTSPLVTTSTLTSSLSTLSLASKTTTSGVTSPATLTSPLITSPLITAVSPTVTQTTLASPLITRTSTITTTLTAPKTTCTLVLIGGRRVCI